MSDYRVTVTVIYGPDAGLTIGSWDVEIDTPGLIDPTSNEEAERAVRGAARLITESHPDDTWEPAPAKAGPIAGYTA